MAAKALLDEQVCIKKLFRALLCGTGNDGHYTRNNLHRWRSIQDSEGKW